MWGAGEMSQGVPEGSQERLGSRKGRERSGGVNSNNRARKRPGVSKVMAARRHLRPKKTEKGGRWPTPMRERRELQSGAAETGSGEERQTRRKRDRRLEQNTPCVGGETAVKGPECKAKLRKRDPHTKEKPTGNKWRGDRMPKQATREREEVNRGPSAKTERHRQMGIARRRARNDKKKDGGEQGPQRNPTRTESEKT